MRRNVILFFKMFSIKSLCFFHTIVLAVSAEDPFVAIDDGIILGSNKITANNISYDSYEGIKYGLAPTGNLRFKAPIPVGPITGVYDARQARPICIQSTAAGIVGSEDCLSMNILVPRNVEPPPGGFPVIFHIHGGTFRSGYAFYNPDNFLKSGLIYAAIQYRLMAFGFLCLDTADVPGNAGLKDQNLALKWVKKNIKKFGGDPNNISLLGESAGAISVQLHQISPMSKGLMDKMITMSGASLCDISIQNNPLGIAEKFANNLKLDIKKPNFLPTIQGLNASAIIEAAYSVAPDVAGTVQQITFSPVVEKIHNGNERKAFITMPPIEYYKSGNYNHVPSIIAETSKEYVLFLNLATIGSQLNNSRVVVPLKWQKVLNLKGIQKVYNIIKKFFFGHEDVDLDVKNNDQLETVVNLFGDLVILKGTYETVRALVKKSRAPVYYYRFSFTGVLDSPFILPLGLVGATHIMDMLVYLSPFENPRIGPFTPDGLTRRRLTAFVKNMAYERNPTPGPYSNLLPIKWLPVTKKTVNYLEINGELTPSTNPDDHRMKFWSRTEKRVFRGDFN